MLRSASQCEAYNSLAKELGDPELAKTVAALRPQDRSDTNGMRKKIGWILGF